MTGPASRWVAVAVASATVAVALAGCTGSSTGGTNFPTQNVLPTGVPTDTINSSISGSALLSASLGDVSKAKSFRLVETSKTKGVTTHVDMRYGISGSVGTITNGSSTLHLIHVAGTTFVKAPDAFWKSQLDSAQLAKYGTDVHNAWVKVPALGTTFGQLSAFTDKEQIVGALVKKDTSKFVRGPKKTIDGVSAIQLTDADKGTVVYVAANGIPYPVRVLGAKGSNAVADFSRWNEALSVAIPADYFALPSG